MTLLNRLSLTTKTRLPVLIVLIIMSSVVAVAYTSFSEQQRVNRTVVEQILPVQNSLEDAYRDLYQVIAAGQGLSVGGLTTENVTHQLAEFQDNGHKARNRLVQVQTLIDAGLLGKQYQSNLDLMLAEFDLWLAHYQAVFAKQPSACQPFPSITATVHHHPQATQCAQGCDRAIPAGPQTGGSGIEPACAAGFELGHTHRHTAGPGTYLVSHPAHPQTPQPDAAGA